MREGLSRIEIWMRMARLIREEIGDALWLGCGGPIWARRRPASMPCASGATSA